jgi:hypothetical protein
MDPALLREAKRVAHDSGKTLTALIEDALRESLARRLPRATKSLIRLPTFGAGGLVPGADLDDSRALQEIMDDDAPA